MGIKFRNSHEREAWLATFKALTGQMRDEVVEEKADRAVLALREREPTASDTEEGWLPDPEPKGGR